MTDWKDNEREIARWAKVGGKPGQRLPSNGKVQADVVTPAPPLEPLFTFESKRRTGASFPKWLVEAFDQADLHRRIHRVKDGYVVLAYHSGRGHGIRWFLCKEFNPKADVDGFTATDEDMTRHAEYIGGLIRALAPEGADDEELAA